MGEQLKISSSPHIRSKATTSNIMMWVVIALLPATAFGIYNFRDTNAWLLVLVTVTTAVLTEYIYEKLMHKKITIQDFSAVVTGLLLALNLPPTAPLWMGALGSIFAIWWPGTEFHESGSWRKMLFADFLYWKNDKFCV